MSETEIRKQISIFLPLRDWQLIRYEAARLNIPITELCRRWMKPGLDRLKKSRARRRRHV